MIPHGFSLIDNFTLGVLYIFILTYLFSGIGAISDIFME
jgi:hypothetical protein